MRVAGAGEAGSGAAGDFLSYSTGTVSAGSGAAAHIMCNTLGHIVYSCVFLVHAQLLAFLGVFYKKCIQSTKNNNWQWSTEY